MNNASNYERKSIDNSVTTKCTFGVYCTLLATLNALLISHDSVLLNTDFLLKFEKKFGKFL